VIGVFLVSLGVLLVLGLPVGFALALTGVVMVVQSGSIDLGVIPQSILHGIDDRRLMAIPFFILAGEIMKESGLSLGIIWFFKTLFARIRGGLGFVSIIAGAIFAGVSASAAADTQAIGARILPLMKNEGYDIRKGSAVICAAGTLGPIIPPSIPMVVYGAMANVSVTRMLLGGILPGLITGALLFLSWRVVSGGGIPTGHPREPLKKKLYYLRDALPSLILPFIIFGAILSEKFSPTEAGALAVLYALAASMLVYRRISLHHMKVIFVKAARSTAVVMLILATATAVSYIGTVAGIPPRLKALILAATTDRVAVLFAVNLLILLLGCVMDVAPAITILTPILLPTIIQMGIDPVFFGIVMVYGLCIGLLTPPVGNVLDVGSGMAKIDFLVLARYVLPHVLVYVVVLFIISLSPNLVMWIPMMSDL